jgi:hypothetical protein
MNTFDVVLTLIKNNPITWIWGCREVTLMHGNIVFRINTFIHPKSFIMVVFDELKETFDILLLDNNMNIIETITDVHISQIVNEIHNAIFGMPKGNVDLEVCRNSLN